MTAWGPFKRSGKKEEKGPPAEHPAAPKPEAEKPGAPAAPPQSAPPRAQRPAAPAPSRVPEAAADRPTQPGPVSEKAHAALHRRTQVGLVVSGKMQHTAVVEVTRLAPHPRYKKILKFRKCYKAHNEGNQAKEGDRVRMVETRPLSKDKRWRIVEILKA